MPDFLQLEHCVCCPRQCGVNRLAGELGYCQTGPGFQIGSICRHQGEEPPIGGERGICNIFFTHCNLRCRYCQNYQISREPQPGLEHALSLAQTVDRVEACLEQGVQAVGFVSPSHVLPQVKALVREIRARGRQPVFVYNTNAYDRVESLAALENDLDVYLPDLKYLDPELAANYSDARDYPQVACAALREMFHQKGVPLVLNSSGQAVAGMIVRHLVLPGQVENSLQVLRFIAGELSPEIHVSLMAQYNPIPATAADPLLGRALTRAEYDRVIAELDRLGLENGWIQDLDSRHAYQPDFRQTHPFEP
jgi:putative pyruvate formate lyase activating enzyme